MKWGAPLVCGLVWLVCTDGAGERALAQAGKPAKPRFEHLHDIPHKGEGVPMTMIRDAADRPFLYVVANEAGLLVYDMKAAPRLVRTIPASKLASLNVMSLSQAGTRLYLALGNHWGKRGNAGLAIIDVAKPAEASVTGVWKDSELNGAGGRGRC